MTSPNTTNDILPKPTNRAELEAGLVKGLADALGISADAVDRTKNFTAFGVDSVKAFALAGDLAEWLDRELSATLYWDHPNLEALSQFLAESLDLKD